MHLTKWSTRPSVGTVTELPGTVSTMKSDSGILLTLSTVRAMYLLLRVRRSLVWLRLVLMPYRWSYHRLIVLNTCLTMVLPSNWFSSAVMARFAAGLRATRLLLISGARYVLLTTCSAFRVVLRVWPIVLTR